MTWLTCVHVSRYIAQTIHCTVLCCLFQDSRICPAAEIGTSRLRTAMVLIWVHLYCAVLGSWVCPPPLPEAETGTDRLWTAVVLYLSTPVPCCFQQSLRLKPEQPGVNSGSVYLSTPVLCCVSSTACGWNRNRQAMNCCGAISEHTCAVLCVSGGRMCPAALPAAETGTGRLWTADTGTRDALLQDHAGQWRGGQYCQHLRYCYEPVLFCRPPQEL